MNNSTRNLKMKKLLIATTALVATAGMASADITISGHAAAGIYSGLGMKNGLAATTTGTKSVGLVTINSSDGVCLLYTSPSPRDRQKSRMPSSA